MDQRTAKYSDMEKKEESDEREDILKKRDEDEDERQ